MRRIITIDSEIHEAIENNIGIILQKICNDINYTTMVNLLLVYGIMAMAGANKDEVSSVVEKFLLSPEIQIIEKEGWIDKIIEAQLSEKAETMKMPVKEENKAYA